MKEPNNYANNSAILVEMIGLLHESKRANHINEDEAFDSYKRRMTEESISAITDYVLNLLRGYQNIVDQIEYDTYRRNQASKNSVRR